jgi:hypothetical protein
LKILDEGKISVGGLYEKLSFDTDNKIITNLDYQRQTSSMYKLQSKLKKFDFILGVRAENYDISGITRIWQNNAVVEKNLVPFNQFRIFPNASVQYNFMKNVYFGLNYNKKINLPNISFLNPNNTIFNNQNINYSEIPICNLPFLITSRSKFRLLIMPFLATASAIPTTILRNKWVEKTC